MRRLNAQDDRWRCLESAATPFQIGALLLFDTDGTADGAAGGASGFLDAVTAQVARRLASTGALVRHRAAPLGFDAGLWLHAGTSDLARHLRRFDTVEPLSRAQLHAVVAAAVMEPLDPHLAPVRLVVLDRLVDGSVAVMLQIHHSLADGIGFQTIVEALTDAAPGGAAPGHPPGGAAGGVHGGLASGIRVDGDGRDESPPRAPLWLARSTARFASEAWVRWRGRADRARAGHELAALRADPAAKRAKTPDLGPLSAASSERRAYDTTSLPLDELRAVGRALGGTVNDVVLTVCGGAVRAHLAQLGLLDGLGERPVVAMVPRSRRRPEHGPLGNHLGLLLPHLGTHIADPRDRFQAVKASMRAEITRAEISDRLTPADDRPFGARRRRRTVEQGTTAGNVSISNVPGPAETRVLGGYRLRANHPMPTLPATQFLNVTVRRYGNALDLGIMVDAFKIASAETITGLLTAAFTELVETARR